ncbi:MAG: hypothetical protein K6G26_06265, partial [Lachnospiraceae bacterium]|nr:hypothetical protein [Lachnospiraceae bacterium]
MATKKIDYISDIVSVNENFKNAVNLYLDYNKIDKVKSYIPTNSSVKIMEQYVDSVLYNKGQASILIGPYGKGKSHLLLVLLALLSLPRDLENLGEMIEKISEIKNINEDLSNKMLTLWKEKRYLPVIISNTSNDLNQSFLLGLNESLKREGLTKLAPETYFTIALKQINTWKKDYIDTYKKFQELLVDNKTNIKEFTTKIKKCDTEAMELFKILYPSITSGSVFNPLANSEALELYNSMSAKLKDYGYDGIYIVFDEFSKYIESKNEAYISGDMKLLQDMCELANSSKEYQVFITFVAHKSIKEYGNYLSKETINAFVGIEGRIEERYFITSFKNNYELIQNAVKKNELIDISEIKDVLNKEIKDYSKYPAYRNVFDK